jgi:spore germination cell wall hydrolase CwlJ-like protein
MQYGIDQAKKQGLDIEIRYLFKQGKDMNIQQGIFWLVLTVFLESRDQPDIGQKNVVKVILNRAHKKDWPLENIVFARKQFSCYNNGLSDALSALIKDYKHIVPVTENVNQAIIEWENGNNLGGATHYYSPKAMIPSGRVPSWAKDMRIVAQEKDHIFLIL